ncbi:MAG: alpha/beta hydrolase fold domain-containing protein [Woeseiaceae bacterium]
MSAWILLCLSLLGAAFVANAAWPTRGPWTLMPSWIGVFLTTDLVFHHIALQIIVVAIFGWFGALDSAPGQVAVAIMVVSSLALIKIWWPARRAQPLVNRAATELDLEEVPVVPKSLLFSPFKRRRDGVEVIHNLEFFQTSSGPLKLDVYQPELASDSRPALLYVHGGAWVFGDKRDQGLPLCNHMASLGWVCFNINYRLSPAATWPEHLIDAKAAVAWVRERADQYAIDPNFVTMTGGSAGAHITAMAALTAGDESLQPGFEDADTSLQAVVTSYGIYDLTNRLGAHNPEFITKMIGPLIIKADPDVAPERFSAASPRDHTNRANQPWLMIHGTADELAPVVEARDFFKALQTDSPAMSALVELPHASHAFDIYYCHRAIAAVELTARFFETCRSSSNAN